MYKLPEETKAIFQEQIEVSTREVHRLQNDRSEEGMKQFDHNVKMINEIKLRVEILVESSEID